MTYFNPNSGCIWNKAVNPAAKMQWPDSITINMRQERECALVLILHLYHAILWNQPDCQPGKRKDYSRTWLEAAACSLSSKCVAMFCTSGRPSCPRWGTCFIRFSMLHVKTICSWEIEAVGHESQTRSNRHEEKSSSPEDGRQEITKKQLFP